MQNLKKESENAELKNEKNAELKKQVKMQNLTNLSENSFRCLVRGCKRGFGHSLICTEH